MYVLPKWMTKIEGQKDTSYTSEAIDIELASRLG